MNLAAAMPLFATRMRQIGCLPPTDANPRAKSYTLRKAGDDVALAISVIWARRTFYVNPTVHVKNLPKKVPNINEKHNINT